MQIIIVHMDLSLTVTHTKSDNLENNSTIECTA